MPLFVYCLAALATFTELDAKLASLDKKLSSLDRENSKPLATTALSSSGSSSTTPAMPVSTLTDHLKAENSLHEDCSPYKGAAVTLDTLQCEERAAMWALDSARTKAKAQQVTLAEMQMNLMWPCYSDFSRLYECMDESLRGPTLAKMAREVDSAVHTAWVWAHVVRSVSAKTQCVATHEKDKTKVAVCIASKLAGAMPDPLG
jgi:hypothetical protein